MYLPFPGDAVSSASEGNTFTALPREQDIAFAAENVLLSPDFYADCVRRTSSNAIDLFGFDANQLEEAISTLISNAKEGFGFHGSNRREWTYQRMQALATSTHLINLARQAFPEISCLSVALEDEFINRKGVGEVVVADCVRRAEQVWQTADMFYGDPLDDLIQLHQPDVVFCAGVFPQSLAFAIASAIRLRSLRPRARIFLVNHGRTLYNTIAHLKHKLLASNELFELFDGAVVYADLQPLTLCELVEALASGKSFDHIENLAFLDNGTVTFNQPTPQTADRFFDQASLRRLYSDVSPFPLSGSDNRNEDDATVKTTLRLAMIFPSQQACYWNQCDFCAINSQNFLLRDPHLARRADEAAGLLQSLPDEGFSWAYLGREAVHPEILRGMVERLSGQDGVLPWGFESRFGTFLSTDFIRGLKRSGCVGTVFGLETPSDRVNRWVGKYDDDMNLSVIERIIDDYMTEEMMVHVNTIVDLPKMTEEDFQNHKKWLKSKFDEYRLFHFNTNSFALNHETKIARHPERYGIKRLDDEEEDEIWNFIPYERLPDSPGPVGDSHEVWKEIFGAGKFWGVPLDTLHTLYHESLYLSFFDAIVAANLFKRLQSEVESFTAITGPRLPLSKMSRYSAVFSQSDRNSEEPMTMAAAIERVMRDTINLGVSASSYWSDAAQEWRENETTAKEKR